MKKLINERLHKALIEEGWKTNFAVGLLSMISSMAMSQTNTNVDKQQNNTEISQAVSDTIIVKAEKVGENFEITRTLALLDAKAKLAEEIKKRNISKEQTEKVVLNDISIDEEKFFENEETGEYLIRITISMIIKK